MCDIDRIPVRKYTFDYCMRHLITKPRQTRKPTHSPTQQRRETVCINIITSQILWMDWSISRKKKQKRRGKRVESNTTSRNAKRRKFFRFPFPLRLHLSVCKSPIRFVTRLLTRNVSACRPCQPLRQRRVYYTARMAELTLPLREWR